MPLLAIVGPAALIVGQSIYSEVGGWGLLNLALDQSGVYELERDKEINTPSFPFTPEIPYTTQACHHIRLLRSAATRLVLHIYDPVRESEHRVLIVIEKD